MLEKISFGSPTEILTAHKLKSFVKDLKQTAFYLSMNKV